MNAYLVSHNGLGDNLFMIGALRFLLYFYNKVYFICKDNHYENVCLFFSDTPNIICVPFNSNNEGYEITSIINRVYNDPAYDVLVCGGCTKSYLQSKITNRSFIDSSKIDKNCTIDYKSITTQNYSFISDFYTDIGLNLTYFFEFFYLPSTRESIELYNSIKQYYIVFIQYSCSTGETLNISNLLKKYINDENVLIVCNDKNLYNADTHRKKYNLCQPFVYNKIVNYVDTIKNSDEIYILDSCLIGIVLPYVKTNQLKTDKVHIILRSESRNTIL